MSLAVLISIRPEWCEKIARGEKTIEIRKNHPKTGGQFKCYIYETKQFKKNKRYSAKTWARRGKVIGEFICDGVLTHCESSNADLAEQYGCIKRELLFEYSKGKQLYGWHISDLVIYDKPIELYEFYNKCDPMHCDDCKHLKYRRINEDEYEFSCKFFPAGHIPVSRPPQSWCYVEELI